MSSWRPSASPSKPTAVEMAVEPERGPRARTVILLVAALVAAVLGVNLLSALIPGLDGVLASLPLVVLVLVGGTTVVLGRALRR